mgnify:CR=1 FL=1
MVPRHLLLELRQLLFEEMVVCNLNVLAMVVVKLLHKRRFHIQ